MKPGFRFSGSLRWPHISLFFLSGSLLLVGCASDANSHQTTIDTQRTSPSNVHKTTLIFTFVKGIDIPTAQHFLKEHGALSITIYKTLSKTKGQVMGSATFPASPTLLKTLSSNPLIQSINEEHVVKPL
ncbi:hypothetical protein Nitsa_0254 [Nitratifractor salsuginis DSM 16511]|uniref:Inhibitor I9 domain-containing protein n=1 Tax=Nitratifractor salsuginis (strain DSM 16511 / JCM 12458 / E9I37-1) TaxID=749222 RepID=E6WZE6_NITSE|nr:hypothetical protein Nitsa_0254 [Nitratifractor salsuginis DSM 16511]